jgi:hypothetical protein
MFCAGNDAVEPTIVHARRALSGSWGKSAITVALRRAERSRICSISFPGAARP